MTPYCLWVSSYILSRTNNGDERVVVVVVGLRTVATMICGGSGKENRKKRTRMKRKLRRKRKNKRRKRMSQMSKRPREKPVIHVRFWEFMRTDSQR